MSNLDPLDIHGQERAEEDRKRRDRLTSEQEIADFKWLMSDKRGRRLVWGLLERTGVYRISFTGNSETFFREGERNIGLYYVALINEHCPEKYNLMVMEQEIHDRPNGTRQRRK